MRGTLLLCVAPLLACAQLDPQRAADHRYCYDVCYEAFGIHADVARFDCVDEPYLLDQGVVTVRPCKCRCEAGW